MKKIVFLILFISLSQLYANENGYMGRKNMIKYELGSWHPYAAGVLVPTIPIFHYGITFEHTFKPGYAYGIVFSRMDMRDKLAQKKLMQNVFLYTENNVTDWTTTSNSSILELNLKRYRKKNKFNPQGDYFTLGLFFMFSQINNVNYAVVGGGYNNPYKITSKRETFNQVDGGPALGFGRNMMIGSRLVIGTEFKVSLPMRSFIKLAYLGDDYEVFERATLYNLLQLKINFGTIF